MILNLLILPRYPLIVCLTNDVLKTGIYDGQRFCRTDVDY